VGDIEFSAAFDIDARKVGADLSEAIFTAPNNTVRFAEVPPLGVPVHRGMTHDGLGHYLSQVITKASGATADIAGILRETRTDVVVNFLPVGQRDGDQVVRGADPRRRLRVRQLHSRLHRPRGILAAPLRGAGPSGGG
jgi:myo-inositol-1-phosphate synthase